MITKKRIGVLMGGISSERDISLKSGNMVAASLKRLGYDVVPIDMGYDLFAKIEEFCIEAAYIALHGRYGEDGCVQGLLEIMGIPYTGSGLTASAICMDKLLSKKMFEYYAIPTPEFTVYSKQDKNELPELNYPVVVKPCREGSTIGISIVSDKEDLQTALEKALHYGDRVIIEKYISGIEVTAGIIDNKPLPLIEIDPKGGFYDFTTKTSKGMADYIVPARLTPTATANIQEIALKTHKSLGCCFVSRVDFRVDPVGNPYVLEVNTVPGMTETSLLPMAAEKDGIGYDALVEQILSSAFVKK